MEEPGFVEKVLGSEYASDYLKEAVRELRAVREAVEKRGERREGVQPKQEETRHV